VTASISPSLTYVPSTPNSVTLAFNANNTGNVSDSYTASITGTTGAVTATLGNAGSPFIIPALGGAQLPLNATLTSGSSGTVTVTITSTSSSSVTAQSTVTIQVGTPNSCDVNHDNQVNVQDVQIMIDEALGLNQPANDLDADGVVNVVDVQIDLNAALKLPCFTGTTGTMSFQSSMKPARTAAPSARAGVSPGGVTPAYGVLDLGTLGGDATVAYGLNNLGQVAGSSDTGKFAGAASRCPRCPISHAFLWEAGRMTDLGLAARGGEAGSSAYTINDAREAAGTFLAPDGLATSFVYENGAIMPFDGVPLARIHGLNNTGQMAGEFTPAGAAAVHAFLWSAGALNDLGTLGGNWSQAYALNDSGQVAGSARLAGDSAMRAFLYDGMGLRDLGTLGGKDSAAYGINGSGQVVGESMTAGGIEHAFLHSGGSMVDLGTLGGASSHANGINNAGMVVGWSLTASGERHAFLWLSGRMVDLNSFANLGTAVWLEEAAAVNDLGQIVANGNNGHAYFIALPMQLQ